MKKLVFLAIFSLILGSVGTFAGTPPKKVEAKVAKTEITTKVKKAPKVQCKYVDPKTNKQCKKKTNDPSGFCKKHNK